MNANQIDTVVIHNGGYIGDDLCNQVLQAAYQAGVRKRVMVFHNDFKKSWLQKLRFRSYDMQINTWATDTVTVSQFTKNRLLANSYLNKDMKVIYNGLFFEDKEERSAKEKRLNYNKQAVHLGMVGNFQNNKGQLDMLKAVSVVRAAVPTPLQVFLIGNVYDEEYFQKCSQY